MCYRYHIGSDIIFCSTKIQSGRRPPYRHCRGIASGRKLWWLRLSRLPGTGRGCRKADSLEGIFCPVGGAETMSKVAGALGRVVKTEAPKIAVVKCNGSCTNRPRTNCYDGARSCAVEHSLYIGETGCCLRLFRMWRLCGRLPL